MKNQLNLKVWISLILLIVLSALVANSDVVYAVEVLILISILKFIGVSFYFMGLKKAHVFWKSSIVIFVLLFSIIAMLII